MGRTEIATLGEFRLIERLTGDILPQQQSTVKGIGDDAAILHNAGRHTLVTTDLLLEDPLRPGLRALTPGIQGCRSPFSDIYAIIAGRAAHRLAGHLKRFSVEVESFYSGIKLACDIYGVDIVGGDTSSSLTGFTISITCIGSAAEGQAVYRNGAKESDLIYVSGDLGASYMGLQLLEREKAAWDGSGDFRPDFDGKEYLLERQLKPEARKDVVDALAAQGIIPTAMIDLSDGISSDLLHICKQSKVGCQLYEERLPIDYQTAMMAETFNMNVTTVALNGGEDYELLFTVPLHLHEKMKEVKGVHLVGHIAKEEQGCYLVTRDGQEMQLRAQGWDPISGE